MSDVIKKTSENNHILKKHVAAIHIGAKLSLLQRKLVNALLYNAYDGLLTSQSHSISASLLCEMIGFDSKNIGYLKAALKGLMETVVEFDVLEEDGERSWEAMVLLPYAKIKGGVCTYRYESSLAEKLYHPDVYSKINLSVLREMNSTHALVLYENCYRYVNIGHTAWWDVDIFRRLMAVDMMPSYKPFKALNRNVIQPAMKEVNKLSNIQVEMETRMKGRSVTGLRFLIKRNAQLSLVGMEQEDEVTSSDAYLALIADGVSKTLARHWVIEHGDDYVLDKIDLAKHQAATGRITSSKAGFLRAAIEQDYKNEHAIKKKRLEDLEKAKQDLMRAEAELSSLKSEIKTFERAHKSICVGILRVALDEYSDDVQKEYEKEFCRTLSSKIFVDSFNRNGWSDKLTYPEIIKFWEAKNVKFPTLSETTRKRSDVDIDDVRARIKQIEGMIMDS